MNYIIAHFDWDGWCSTAILSRYLNIKNYIFTSNGRLVKTLSFLVNNLNKEEKNIIFILDFSIVPNSIQKLMKFFKNTQHSNIHFLWFDHHRTPENIKFLINRSNLDIFLDPNTPSTAMLIKKFMNVNLKDDLIQDFIEYAEFPNFNKNSKYWYKILQNLIKNRFNFGYFILIKILFNLFSIQKQDTLSDYFYNLENNDQINNETNIIYSTYLTSRNNRLILIEEFTNRSDIFQLFRSYDLMLVYYNDGKLGCYSKNISLDPLFSIFNAKGHETACIFYPFVQDYNNFTKYLSKNEILERIKELF
ncbi:MAG: DHH family phosphoesterase [Candidatus Helarchaeota archaeon]